MRCRRGLAGAGSHGMLSSKTCEREANFAMNPALVGQGAPERRASTR